MQCLILDNSAVRAARLAALGMQKNLEPGTQKSAIYVARTVIWFNLSDENPSAISATLAQKPSVTNAKTSLFG